MRIVLPLAAAVLLGGCEFGDVGPSDRYQTDFHYTYDLAANGKVNAETFNGAIDISGWDQNKVEITGAKYGATEALRDSVKVEVHNSPDSVDIRAIKPSGTNGNMGARIAMRVPRQALLDRIVTSNGQIKVRDVAAAAHLKSSNGAINVMNVSSDIDVHTSNGSIDAEQIHGGATLKSSNGKIRAEGIEGPLEAETSNGSITTRSASTASARLISSNGGIEAVFEKAPKGDIKAETRNSSIKVTLPASTAAHISADTSNGSVTSDFDVQGRSDTREERKHLNGTIGAGGPNIELSTSNSSIHIAKGAGN